MSRDSSSVLLGIGDDCAQISLKEKHTLLTSSDLLVSGRHFFPDVDPYDLGHKALAVNLSDLAAMGATPVAFTLSLALGRLNEDWLERFSRGLFSIAKRFDCPLVGGDTSSSSREEDCVISITVFGQIAADQSILRRDFAESGDDVWVSGLPGLGRLGLLAQSDRRSLLDQFLSASEHDVFRDFWGGLSGVQRSMAHKAIDAPEPRVSLGTALIGVAKSAIDLSDGLAGDLKHLMTRSAVGFELYADLIQALWLAFEPQHYLPYTSFLQSLSLQGGDDYELCFTASPSVRHQIELISSRLNVRCTRIGRVVPGDSLILCDGDQSRPIVLKSFNHFER